MIQELYFMAFYESVFITRQDLTPIEVDKLTEKFAKIVKDGNGKLVKSEYWGLRDLAYEVKKNTKGHFIMMHLDAPYAAIAEMKRVMGFTETIIRSLTFKISAIPQGNSKLFVAKNAKDGRSGSNYKGRDSREETESPKVTAEPTDNTETATAEDTNNAE